MDAIYADCRPGMLEAMLKERGYQFAGVLLDQPAIPFGSEMALSLKERSSMLLFLIPIDQHAHKKIAMASHWGVNFVLWNERGRSAAKVARFVSKCDSEVCIYSQCDERSLRQLNKVRRLLGGHASRVRLSVFLHPSSSDNTHSRGAVSDRSKEQTLSCWLAENIKGVYWTSQHDNGEPFISKLLKRNTPILLAPSLSVSKISTIAATLACQSELEHLFEPFFNVPQFPLEPLRDSLCAHTYHNFEQDTAKYDLYEKAIRLALEGLPSRAEAVRVAVIGAGRGPLVDAVLRAGHKGPIVIVEKNADALDTLRYRLRCEWQSHSAQIRILAGNASRLRPPFPCTVVVSELLGSFGDNELCPEILNGMQRHGWYEEHAINIPQSYSSFLMPCYAPQIRDNLCRLGLADEAACVVLPQSAFIYDKAVFSLPAFTHTDTRLCRLRFSAKSSFAVAHTECVTGFLGYFKATLYGAVEFSTHPSLKEGAPFSWFPLYFPIDRFDGRLRFWRRADKHAVWYEWASGGKLHNLDGHAQRFSKKPSHTNQRQAGR